MKSKHSNQPLARADLLPAIEVRITQYNRSRMSLMQLLIPLAGLSLVAAKAFQSAAAFVPSLLLSLGCLYLFISARSTESGLARALPGRLKLAGSTVHSGEFGRWRWYDGGATVFAAGGNLKVVARSRRDAERLQALLRAALGEPLRYRRRGSAATLMIAGASAILGVLFCYLAIFRGINFLALIGTGLMLGGFAVLGAFSQSVLDQTSAQDHQQRPKE